MANPGTASMVVSINQRGIEHILRILDKLEKLVPGLQLDKLKSVLKKHRKGGTFDYSALPPEIRNQIMRLVLISRDGIDPPPRLNLSPLPIKLPIPRYRRILSSMKLLPAPKRMIHFKPKPIPGIQLLATNREALEAGQVMFYADNVFYVPYGDFVSATSYFDNLTTEHRTMIRNLALRYSIHDLTPENFEAIEDETYRRFGPDPFGTPAVASSRWSVQVELVMENQFCKKLSYIRTWLGRDRYRKSFEDERYRLKDLMTVRLLFPRRGFLFSDTKAEAWYIACDARDCFATLWDDVRAELEFTKQEMRENVRMKILELGWQGFKQVHLDVYHGKPVREMDFYPSHWF